MIFYSLFQLWLLILATNLSSISHIFLKFQDKFVHLDDHIETDGDGGSNEKPRRGEPNVPQHTLPLCVQLALMIISL